jgi:hypothetical protein
MKADAVETLRRALRFAEHTATDEDIRRAVASVDFAQLQAQEKERGFREAPRGRVDRTFFRRGKAGSWRDELTAEQVRRIEEDHAAMMLRLGYTPTYGA